MLIKKEEIRKFVIQLAAVEAMAVESIADSPATEVLELRAALADIDEICTQRITPAIKRVEAKINERLDALAAQASAAPVSAFEVNA